MPDNRNTVLYIGLTVAAVGAGWWLVGRLRRAPFQVGQRVRSVAQPSLLGTVVATRRNPSGGWNVDVQWDDGTFVSYGGNLDLVIVAA